MSQKKSKKAAPAGIWIDDALKAAAVAAAVAQRRSFSEWVCFLIEDELEKRGSWKRVSK